MKKTGVITAVEKELLEYIEKNKGVKWIFHVVIKKKPNNRTIPQNKLFHVLFHIIEEQEVKLWNKVDFHQVKALMKMSAFWVKEVKIGEHTQPYPARWTSDLSDAEWIEFVEFLIELCNTKYNLEIKSRDDERLLDYYNNYTNTWERHF